MAVLYYDKLSNKREANLKMKNDGPNPKQRRSREDLWWGVGLGVFGLVLLVGFLTPNFVKSPSAPNTRAACISNLRNIDAAKQLWAEDTKASSNSVPTWQDLGPYLGFRTNGDILKCPAGGVYTIGVLSNAPACSIKEHTLQ